MAEKKKAGHLDFLGEQVLKKPESPKPMIFVDSREFYSPVVEALGKFDCIVKSKRLEVADYLCSERVGIERKAAQDFLNSITDQRLFQQAEALKESFEKPILLIEGNDLYGRLNPNSVRGALASIAIDYGIPIMWSANPQESAALINWIARREQLTERRELAVRGEKKAETVKDVQEFIVAGLPGVSNVKARALLKKFGSPAGIFAASEQELKEAEGIGEKLAQKIREVLEKEY
ncbi:MAG: hypothetical protein HY362_02405 [Candidatus Aenigmarchaeota archaeon]|nr:hypothetical protein [Candidatus Aenigmarchaeota archaeon]